MRQIGFFEHIKRLEFAQFQPNQKQRLRQNMIKDRENIHAKKGANIDCYQTP